MHHHATLALSADSRPGLLEVDQLRRDVASNMVPAYGLASSKIRTRARTLLASWQSGNGPSSCLVLGDVQYRAGTAEFSSDKKILLRYIAVVFSHSSFLALWDEA